jgi:transcription initiation factor TFIID TATA-box-binding protein
MTDVDIENIVCFIKIADSFDINNLSNNIPDATYNPSEFEGLSIRYNQPKTAAIIISNGKIVCTGAKEIKDAKITFNKTIDKINDTGLSIKKDFVIKIDNVVASVNLYKNLHLSSIAKGLILKNVSYKPKNFPGLIYKRKHSDAVTILFSSGKIICTGARSIDEAKNEIKVMKENLSSIGAL